MAYRVCLSEGFIQPLPPRIRGCIRGELARVAEMAEKLPHPIRRASAESFPVSPLPDGYWMSYRLDERARTVRLMVVAQPKKAAATRGQPEETYSAPMNG